MAVAIPTPHPHAMDMPYGPRASSVALNNEPLEMLGDAILAERVDKKGWQLAGAIPYRNEYQPYPHRYRYRYV